MKNILKITLLAISILTLTQCKDDDDKPDKPNYGAEYFKCKVNGVEFQTLGYPFGCEGLIFYYYPEAYLTVAEKYMVFGSSNCSEKVNMSIRIDGLEHTTGILDFLEPAFADSIYPYYRYLDMEDSIYVKLETLVDGEMKIIDFIPRQDGSSPYGTFKGTFHFTLTDSMGIDTIRVTDGSFRFDVPQIF